MLTAQQQAFVQALEELDLQQVQRLLTDGLSLNFIDPEKGESYGPLEAGKIFRAVDGIQGEKYYELIEYIKSNQRRRFRSKERQNQR